jgi:hypothetical protein
MDPLPKNKKAMMGLVQAALVLGALVAALVAFVMAVHALFPGLDTGSPGKPPEGVKSYSHLSRHHVEGPVHYAQNPPVGGNHNPVWQNCGFYPKPLQNVHAVHSMEHGSVWITYRPELPKDQVEKIKKLVEGQTYLLASPYPNLPAPVVASAWGEQLELGSANDPRLEQFVKAFREGPQTPEPGAPCIGGIGSPQ